MSEGESIVIEVKKSSRNAGRHRLYWALLSVASENLPETDGGNMDAELLHALLKQKLELGHWVTLPSGDRIFDYRSTSFSKMTGPEFDQYFERVNAVLARWLGVDPLTLIEEARLAA